MFALFPVQGKVRKGEKLDDLERLLCTHVARAMLFLEYVQTERVWFLDHAESPLAATCEVILPLSEKVGEPFSSKM